MKSANHQPTITSTTSLKLLTIASVLYIGIAASYLLDESISDWFALLAILVFFAYVHFMRLQMLNIMNKHFEDTIAAHELEFIVRNDR